MVTPPHCLCVIKFSHLTLTSVFSAVALCLLQSPTLLLAPLSIYFTCLPVTLAQ